jgi:hypothetical protein
MAAVRPEGGNSIVPHKERQFGLLGGLHRVLAQVVQKSLCALRLVILEVRMDRVALSVTLNI